MYTDVIHTVDANQTPTGVGDGRSRLFPLLIGEQRINPTVVNSVFVGDWQGPMSPLFPYPRTNLNYPSWGFQNWQDLYVDVARPTTQIVGPDGFMGRATAIELGTCVGGPNGDRGGFYDLSAVPDMDPEAPYVASIWLRADEPLVARLALDDGGPEAGVEVNVGTAWALYWVAATTGTTPSRGLSVILSTTDNLTVSPTANLYSVYAQTERDLRGGFPSRYIETTSAPVTITDYRLTDSSILTTDPVANEAPLYWTGSGYWVEVTSTYEQAVVDTLSAVTWRYDQSPNLLSLLKSKRDWYSSNHTQFWRGWNSAVFDLTQANNFGVAVWAFILNVPLNSLSLDEEYRYWAFGPTRDNFTDSNEPGEINPTGGNFPPVNQSGAITTLKEKIQALRLKYYALTSDCSITNINKALADVFDGEGLCYVEDHEDMTMTYVFTFPVSADFRQSMLEYGLLPKPAGVKITITAP